MTKSVLAIFNTAEEAFKAARDLNLNGFANDAVTLMSSEPLHAEAAEAPEEKGSRMGLFAVAGAFLGAAAALTLTVTTSRQVDLVTGGMPIVTPWAFGIIVFELTALGAIIAVVGRMIFEARLLRRSAVEGLHSYVVDGKILVAVECLNGTSAEAAETLLITRGAQIL